MLPYVRKHHPLDLIAASRLIKRTLRGEIIIFNINAEVSELLRKYPPKRGLSAAVEPDYGDSVGHSKTSFLLLDLIIHYLMVIVKKNMENLHIVFEENVQKLHIWIAYLKQKDSEPLFARIIWWSNNIRR